MRKEINWGDDTKIKHTYIAARLKKYLYSDIDVEYFVAF